MNKKMHLILITLLSLFFSSCVTNRLANTTVLNGIIYDMENEPVSGVFVYIDDENQAVSDIYGHFYITGLKVNQSYNLTIKKELYEQISLSFDYLNESQVIYIKTTSFQQLLNFAEQEIKKNNYSKAQEYLLRADSVCNNNYSCKYLSAINFYHKKDYDSAITILNELLAIKKESYVYLLLADCYQYGKNDLKKAKECLKFSLDIQHIQKIKQRYDSL